MWFRVSIGRYGGADPRWLLPLICRRGGITRREVGRIEIGDRETRVEIAPWAAEQFARSVQVPGDGEDARVRFAPMNYGPPPPQRRGPPRGPRPVRR